MKKFLLAAASISILSFGMKAQNPTKCFEIESILVDACNATSLEPNNEMFVFKVGPNPINIANLSLSGEGGSGTFVANAWPTTTIPWLGLIQNAGTATVTAALQSTITNGCGQLIEPPGGIIPAYASVLVVASSNPSTTDNSFAALTDTLYIVYHNATYGSTTGHFKNSSGVASALSATPYAAANPTRGIILIDASSGCADTVIYDITLLTNTLTATPYGGSSAQNDGATVDFAWPGFPTTNYINNGCKAPFIPLSASASPTNTTICSNGSLTLNGTAGGTYTLTTWTGGSGTYGNANSLNTTYTPGAGESGNITLTLTVYGKCAGAIATSTVAVTIIALPAPVISTLNGTVCNGDSTVLTVNNQAGVTYAWSPGAGTGTSFTVAPNAPTIYTVVATNTCAVVNATFSVNVNPLPVVSATSASVCPGFTATISASGATTYTWNTGTVSTSISDSPPSTTQYTVTGTDGNGCINTGTGTIFIYNSPTVTVNSPSICVGGTVTLNASGASTYTWSTTQNGNSISVNPSGNTSYTVVGTDANGCDNFAVSNVIVNSLPVITVNSITICPTATATLTAGGANTYTWSTGAQGSTFTVSPASTSTFTVVGESAAGCIDSTTASVTVVNTVTVTATPANAAICSGSSTILTGNGATSYTWSPAGSLSSSGGTSVTASPTVTTTYTVVGASGSCIDTNTVSVSVNNLPTVGGTATQSVVCAGTSITLTGSGAQTYTWTGGVTDGIPFTPSSTQTYTVNGTDINGCTNSASVLVTVNTVSVTAATGNPAICSGSSTSLTGNGATNYTWSPAGSLSSSTGTSVTASPTVTTTYTVIGSSASCADTSTVTVTVNNLPTITANTSTTSVCQGGSVTLTGGGGLIYVWTGGASNGIPFTPSSTQTYTVVGVDINGCSNLAAVTVTVNPLPIVSVSSASICTGATATLTASGAITYSWSTTANGSTITVSPGSNTSYTVTGTDANGCKNTDVSSVTVFALPIISVNSPTTCAGSNVNLNATGGISYSWSSGQSGSTVSVPGVATSYTVTGTDANGCSNTNVATVSVLPSPIGQAIAGIPVICAGQTTTLSVTNPGSYSYTWSGPSGAAGNGTSITTGQAGVYTVMASNACGSTSATFTVAVSSPHAGFTPNNLGGQAPANVVFTNTSTGVQLQNYWNFSNGDTSHQINTAETFTTAGTYSVTLMVTDSFGCIDITTVIILVTDQPSVVIIPNVFSPNGDNINDMFTITATGVSNFNCKIYDRWGLLLYEWFDAKGGWDGKNATDGTYYFLLNYTDNKKNNITKPGYLQLVR